MAASPEGLDLWRHQVPVCPEQSDLLVAVGHVSSLRHTLNVCEPARHMSQHAEQTHTVSV